MNPADSLGIFVKFANPTVANGKVYVPTMSNQLVVYGLAGGGDGDRGENYRRCECGQLRERTAGAW